MCQFVFRQSFHIPALIEGLHFPEAFRFCLERPAGEFVIEKVANYPNPFGPGTKNRQGTDFAYILTSNADKVTLKVYTITGRLVVLIDTLDGFAGYNEFHWEGFDRDDEELSNGVYLYKIIAEKEGDTADKTGKLAILR